MTQYQKSGGVWKPVLTEYTKSGGTWKTSQGSYVKDGGVWKKYYEPYNISFVGFAERGSGSAYPTFGPFDFGDAYQSREIIVLWHIKPSGSSAAIPGAASTIGGVTTTQRFAGSRGSNPDSRYGYMMATVPSGTSGSVYFDSNNTNAMAVYVFRVAGRTNVGTAAYDYSQVGYNSNPRVDLTVSAPSAGFALGQFGSDYSGAISYAGDSAGVTGVTFSHFSDLSVSYWGESAATWTTAASAAGNITMSWNHGHDTATSWGQMYTFQG